MSITLGAIAATVGTIAAIAASINTIIQSCDQALETVNKSLSTIRQQSEGTFVDSLDDANQKLVVHYDELIRGLQAMQQAVQAANDEMERADATSASSVTEINVYL